MTRRIGSGALCVFCAVACATPSLSSDGSKVVPVTTAPGPECQNLGVVVGKGGGTVGGSWISNDQLTQYAMNDALSKAAARGANTLQITPPQLGGGKGTTSTATETAIAFKCPTPPATPETPAPAAH